MPLSDVSSSHVKVTWRGQRACLPSPWKSYHWAVGFFFNNPELSMQLWIGIIGTSGFDAEALFVQQSVTTTHCRVARY